MRLLLCYHSIFSSTYTMSMFNSKFIHVNMLRAAELRFGPDVMFSDGLRKTIEAWCPVLRMDATASSIALLNIVATTLEFSSVARSAGDRIRVLRDRLFSSRSRSGPAEVEPVPIPIPVKLRSGSRSRSRCQKLKPVPIPYDPENLSNH